MRLRFWLFLSCALPVLCHAMEYVEVCSPDHGCRRFSRLVMGTDHLNQSGWTSDLQPEPTLNSVYAVLDEAAFHGINLFDTAPIYVGSVENVLGKWRASRVSRIGSPKFLASPLLNPDRKLYALSKGGFPFDLSYMQKLPAGCHSIELINELKRRGIMDAAAMDWQTRDIPLRNVPAGTYASHLYCNSEVMLGNITTELAHTCANLGCEIDVYLMHRDDGDAIAFERLQREQTPVQRILQAVSSSAIVNHVGFIGWSNWETSRVNESLALANTSNQYVRPVINSPYFSLLEMSGTTIHALGVQVTHAQMMDPEFQRGIKIMPYSPLGGFSILDQPAPTWEKAKAFALKKFEAGDPYWRNVYPSIFTAANEERWKRAEQFLIDFNRRHNSTYTMDQLLNAYALAHPRTDMLAVGAISVEQVRRTVASLKMSKLLLPQDLDYLYSGQTLASGDPKCAGEVATE